jgi:cell growth-regulating nucleolar protein
MPPSPPDVDSPQSPLKRSKQARVEDIKTRDKDKKRAEKLAEKEAKKKSKLREEKKKEKKSKTSALDATKDMKNGRWVRTRSRKDSSMQEQVSEPEQPAKRVLKAIEYHPTNGSDDKLKATPNNAMVLHSKKSVARAEVFLSAAAKDLESDRGCSINKALKRYYRDHASRKNAKDEKDLFKVLRFKKNDRGELVLFIDGPE